MTESSAKLGLRVLRERPSLIVSEIAWRWLFGSFAIALFYFASRRFAHALAVPPETEVMLASGDLQQGIAGLTEVVTAALPILARMAVITLPTLGVAWTVAATIGRASILQTLLDHFGAAPHRARPGTTLYILNLLRVLSLALLVAGYFFAGAVSSRFVGNPDEPNLVAAVLVFLFVFAIAYAIWSVVHFLVALAPIFAVREACGITRSLARAFDFTTAHAAKLFAISSSNGTLRFMAAFVVTAIGLLPLLAAGAIPVTFIVAFEILLSLIYCVISDALLVARLASYVALIANESRSSHVSGA